MIGSSARPACSWAPLLGLLIAAGCQLVASNQIRLYDDDQDQVDVEPIARAVCGLSDRRDWQISRVSTVEMLVHFFDREVNGTARSELLKCKQQHGEALQLLWDVLSASNENVCSNTKLALIEHFHVRFVSTYIEHVTSRAMVQRHMAPRLLRLLFMHYAMEVDAICKRSLINNIEWDLRERFGASVNEKLLDLTEEGQGIRRRSRKEFDAIFNGALKKFTEVYAIEHFEDVLLVWDMIEDSYLSQNYTDKVEAIRDEHDPVTGEPVRLLVKVKRRGYLDEIKRQCHYNFKPIYSKLILPIVRLANLGYSNRGEQFEIELEELRGSELVRRWYSVTQLCEAMLPIVSFEEPSLGPNEVVVITKEEAAELERAQLERQTGAEPEPGRQVSERLEYEPKTNSLLGVDRIESVSSVETQALVRAIRLNLSARDHVNRRAIVQLLRSIKRQLKSSSLGRFFLSDSSRQKQEVGLQLARSLEEMDEGALLRMRGALAPKRLVKSRQRASGIGSRRRYSRKGDVDMILEMRADALSYTRTKTWSEIFAGWGEVLSLIKPSRTKMIIFGTIVVAILLVVLFCSITVTVYAG